MDKYSFDYDSITGELIESGSREALGLFGLGVAVLVTLCMLMVVVYVVYVIGMWKAFAKAGEEGWKAIIPIYNMYIMYKISWKTSMFWITLALAVVAGIFNALVTVGAFFAVLSSLVSIALVVISIMLLYKFSKAYGYGAGFTVGLIFLPFIFVLILGFGSAEYIGAQE